MKTKVIVATLLVVATATADARFAWLYPRKAVSPGESGHWIVINGNPSSHDVKSEPERRKIIGQVRKKYRTSRNGFPGCPRPRIVGEISRFVKCPSSSA